MIAIADFPQLRLIAWNRRADDRIDEAALTNREKTLIEHLRDAYGGGVLNV